MVFQSSGIPAQPISQTRDWIKTEMFFHAQGRTDGSLLYLASYFNKIAMGDYIEKVKYSCSGSAFSPEHSFYRVLRKYRKYN